jgi:predicted DNA-binding transcriptional regulator AlpA
MGDANDNAPLCEDLLRGAAAIAAFMGFERRQIYHLVSKNILPTFRGGDIVCARKSTLLAWIEQQEAASKAA